MAAVGLNKRSCAITKSSRNSPLAHTHARARTSVGRPVPRGDARTFLCALRVLAATAIAVAAAAVVFVDRQGVGLRESFCKAARSNARFNRALETHQKRRFCRPLKKANLLTNLLGPTSIFVFFYPSNVFS